MSTAPTSNKAAWLDERNGPLSIRDAPVPQLESGQLLIRNHAVAINPIDWKMQELGVFIKSYPTILGSDLAGEVVDVGPDVTGFEKGDRVLAHPLGAVTGNSAESPFQTYTVARSILTARIPDDMTFEQATVLPLSVSTAAHGLYGKDELNLPYPQVGQPKKSGKSLLLWGGSSSVGSSVIQLAVASGVEVVTTASKRNFEYCKKLGARAVFDHNSPSVVGDLVAELQKGDELVGAYDAIGVRDSSMNTAQVLAQLGGGYIANALTPPEDIPATVNSKQVFAPSIALREPEIAEAVYGKFLPEALKSGQMKAMPEADVIGSGLEKIQEGIAKLKAGVSASKVVIKL